MTLRVHPSGLRLRVHPSALNHGLGIEEISHAVDLAWIDREIDPDNDPPKILIIGPDPAGNPIELIGGEIADEILFIWHAMKCRDKYLRLIPHIGGDL